MKKLGKLKLNQLSKNQLEKKELNIFKGGQSCGCHCGCEYAGEQCSQNDSYYGGSSTSENSAANDISQWQYY